MANEKSKSMGPIAFVIGADPEKKIVIFQFGRQINRLEFGPEEAMEIASNIIGRAAVAAGKTVAEMVASRQERNEATAAQRPKA